MYYTVYKITNLINKKIYIGVHKTQDLDDSYMGSGTVLKLAIEKHGVENFKKEYISIFDNSEEMFNMESQLVNEHFIKDTNTYNLKLGGEGGFDYINNETDWNGFKYLNENGLNNSVNQHIKGSLRHLELLETDSDYRDNWLLKIKENNPKAFKGKTHTNETKKQMSESHKGKHEGSKNSQFGSMWIHNLEEKLSKKIKKDELPVYEEQGWLKGRKMKF